MHRIEAQSKTKSKQNWKLNDDSKGKANQFMPKENRFVQFLCFSQPNALIVLTKTMHVNLLLLEINRCIFLERSGYLMVNFVVVHRLKMIQRFTKLLF